MPHFRAQCTEFEAADDGRLDARRGLRVGAGVVAGIVFEFYIVVPSWRVFSVW